MLWNIAASKGHKDAVSNLDVVEKKMTSEDVQKAQRFARMCLAKDYKNCNWSHSLFLNKLDAATTCHHPGNKGTISPCSNTCRLSCCVH